MNPKQDKTNSTTKVKAMPLFLCVSVAVLGGIGIALTNSGARQSESFEYLLTMAHEVSQMANAHLIWRQELTEAVLTGTEFENILDLKTCELGSWLYGASTYEPTDEVIIALIEDIHAPHDFVHREAHTLWILAAEDARRHLFDVVLPETQKVTSLLIEMESRYLKLIRLETESIVANSRVLFAILTLIVIILMVLAFYIISFRAKKQLELQKALDLSEYENKKYLLTSSALNVAMWDLKVVPEEPVSPDNPIEWSREFRKLLGFTDEAEFPNYLSSWIERIHPDDKARTLNDFATHITDHTGQTAYNIEFRLKVKNGQYRHFHAFGDTMRDSNDVPIRVAGAIMDIDERVKTAEALSKSLYEQKRLTKELELALQRANAANLAKSEFLSVMSHEIRTPMNSIMGFAELALNCDTDSTSPQVKEHLVKITDNTKWLLSIINDILDISKIESGKMELEHVPFGLHEIISRCQSVVLPSAREKGLDLRVYVEALPSPKEGVRKKILGDPVRLYQALLNLLSNAVKFTEKGSVKLSAIVEDSDRESVTIRFEVKDSGIGMTKCQIERIYKPFVQADSSTTRNYGGTGLGLAITKSIVELMGGKLAVASIIKSGSTFSFTVTFDTTECCENATQHQKQNALERPHFNGLVLVCDDNHMNQQVMCGHLANVGLETVVADNGKIAVDLVSERMCDGLPPFDLILMDMFMPVMDGIDAANEITKLNVGTPIIAVTANIMVSELEKYKKHGMRHCLGKPFTALELWHILLKYLTPLDVSDIKAADEKFECEMQKELRINFVKNNRDKYAEITAAIAAGDCALARRLAHNLKGNAGFIGKKSLQEFSAKIESILQHHNEENAPEVPQALLNALEAELNAVMSELQPLLNELEDTQKLEKARSLENAQIAELFKKLEPMLLNRDSDCLDLLDDIRAVSGSEKLVNHIEKIELKLASVALAELKQTLKLN